MRIGDRDATALVKKFGSPLYVYDGDAIRKKARALRRALPGMTLQYACKANTAPSIVRLIAREGFGVETVSPGELRVARAAGIPVSRLTYTCGSIGERELYAVVRQGVRVHLDSLRQVELFGMRFPGRKISVRLNQGIGAGHHAHVITGGPNSKFGIDVSHLDALRKLTKKYSLRIDGLHQHIGSNILAVPMFLKAMDALLTTAHQFPFLKHLDFGGGFGVPYRPEERPLDITLLGRRVRTKMAGFAKAYGSTPEVSFEPGRYLVAEAGYLLVTVNDVKHNPSRTFVGVDSGFNHLLRPALYDAYHEIVNVSRPGARKEPVTIAGNICESGDLFAKDRLIPMPRVGDILAIRNAGAYGYSMSSLYNLRPRPRQVLVRGKQTKLI